MRLARLPRELRERSAIAARQHLHNAVPWRGRVDDDAENVYRLGRRAYTGVVRAGMTPLVPKSLTSNSKADGRFDKRDFVYIAEDDEYRCPAGQRAIKRFTTIEHGMTLHKM